MAPGFPFNQVRDELEQLLDDDEDMADLYLSRKTSSSSPVSGSGPANWFPASPTIGSKISRASRASIATARGDEDDIEELEMLLEVIVHIVSGYSIFLKVSNGGYLLQAYFMQIDGTLNKLTTVSSPFSLLIQFTFKLRLLPTNHNPKDRSIRKICSLFSEMKHFVIDKFRLEFDT